MDTQKTSDAHREPELGFVDQAKDFLSPANWWKNPWMKVALGVAAGFAIAQIGRRRGEPRHHESFTHAIVRAGLAAATGLLVKQALAVDTTEPHSVRS